MQAPTPIAILRGPDHVVELANAMTCQAVGARRAECSGRPLFEALPELEGQPFKVLLDEVFRTGSRTSARRRRRTSTGAARRDSRRVYLNFVYQPLPRRQGEVEGILVIAFEVTDEVKARDEINALRAAEQSANRTKDEFLAMLGHELRNPLAPILTALQLMTLRGDAGAERERTVIDRQVRHLVRLVDDLLDVSRIARGKIELRRQPVEIGDVVARRSRAPARCSRSGSIISSCDVPRTGCSSTATSTRLAQVVANVLTNAAKYTEPAAASTCQRRLAGEPGRAARAGHGHRDLSRAAAERVRDVHAGSAGARSRRRAGWAWA